MSSKDFKTALLNEITIDNIPKSLGGNFELVNEPFEFDLSPSGGLYFDYSNYKKSNSPARAPPMPRPSGLLTLDQLVIDPSLEKPMPLKEEVEGEEEEDGDDDNTWNDAGDGEEDEGKKEEGDK